jgi:ribosomal RNA-processing protein 9
MALDVLRRETGVSTGRDRTARFWKWSDDKQLVFRGSTVCTSLECCRMLTEETFVTGDDDGKLAIWSTTKKKPVMQVDGFGDGSSSSSRSSNSKNSSSSSSSSSADDGGDGRRPWISALASVRTTDLVASGSSEGCVRLWKASDKPRRILKPVGKLPGLAGFANGLAFASDGRFLLCAMGQEHRLGRWERIQDGGAKNALAVVPLSP